MNNLNLNDILKHGAQNAVPVDVLAAKLHTTPRGVRSLIMKAREQGDLILYAPGGRGGYFLPSRDPEQARREISAFYAVQTARCKHGLAALAAVRRALNIPAGQLDFDGEAGADCGTR